MSLLVYGVTGYTGALVSRTAAAAGVDHIAASRNLARVEAHAQPLGMSARAFALDDSAGIDRGLKGVTAVLNCAGPFARTAEPLVSACLRNQVHYMDLAGEVPEFERLYQLDASARQAGVMLLPGVGFGVVPTDCVAAKLAEKVPEAQRLTIAYETRGGVSRGTLENVLFDIYKPGVVRHDGDLTTSLPGAVEKKVDLGHGPVKVVTNPWRADLVSAFVSTGIRNIETYATFPAPVRWLMRAGWLLERGLVQRMLRWLVRRAPAGPSTTALAQGSTAVLGEVEDRAGRVTRLTLRGPEAYLFTARAAAEAGRRVLAGASRPGYQTPSAVFGADFVTAIDGVALAS